MLISLCEPKIMEEERHYPIGLQNFSEIIEREGVYIDKTEYVYKMANSTAKYFFLSRPRRFGKSLLVSTLEAYFLGRKDLFEGLAISKMEKAWTKHPVIHLDLSGGNYDNIDIACANIDYVLKEYEEKLRIIVPKDQKNFFGIRLANIIKQTYEKENKCQIVVLIDEYDKPMLATIDAPELQNEIRKRIRDLFSPLKSQDWRLRFVFLTGISQFSQLSVFSELNNLYNITFDENYEACCGITEEELITQMDTDIKKLQRCLQSTYPNISYKDTLTKLKKMYDGYHFSNKMTDIYNPWSLFNTFEMGQFQHHWFGTGTPTSLINLLNRLDLDQLPLNDFDTNDSRFNAPIEQNRDPVPVLFQSGYLSLKSYYPQSERYKLGFPNEEVRVGFANSLVHYFLYNKEEPSRTMTRMMTRTMSQAYRELFEGNRTIHYFLRELSTFYSAIPYSVNIKNERHYQSILYAVLTTVGADVEVEKETAIGRMDLVLKIPNAIYIIEFKYDKDASSALQQIKDKFYAVAFAQDERSVFGIGLNISSKRRTFDINDGYKIDKLDTTLPSTPETWTRADPITL